MRVLFQRLKVGTEQRTSVLDQAELLDRTEDVPDNALAPMILAHAPSYHSTASRLTSLHDLPLPDATMSVNLISMAPRLERAKAVSESHEEQIAELRARSARAVGRWHQLGIVSMGECWSEWESRLMHAERVIRRAQARKKRDEEAT